MGRAHRGDLTQDGWHPPPVAYATVGSRLAKAECPIGDNPEVAAGSPDRLLTLHGPGGSRGRSYLPPVSLCR